MEGKVKVSKATGSSSSNSSESGSENGSGNGHFDEQSDESNGNGNGHGNFVCCPCYLAEVLFRKNYLDYSFLYNFERERHAFLIKQITLEFSLLYL